MNFNQQNFHFFQYKNDWSLQSFLYLLAIDGNKDTILSLHSRAQLITVLVQCYYI